MHAVVGIADVNVTFIFQSEDGKNEYIEKFQSAEYRSQSGQHRVNGHIVSKETYEKVVNRIFGSCV